MVSDGYSLSAEDLRLFTEETLEQLEALEEEIIKLEDQACDPHLLQDMFRIAHTVKGSSATIGQTRMSTLAHAMEDAFARLRDGKLFANRDLVDILLEAVDALRILASEVEAGSDEAGLDIQPCLARLQEALSPASDEASSAYEVHVTFDEKAAMPAVRALQVIQALGELGTLLHVRPSVDDIRSGSLDGLDVQATLLASHPLTRAKIAQEVDRIPDIETVEVEQGSVQGPGSPSMGRRFVFDAPAEERRDLEDDGLEDEKVALYEAPKILGRVTDQMIRVDVDSFDKLVRIVSELAIDEARLVELQRRLTLSCAVDPESVEGLEQLTGRMGRLTTQLQEEVMKARMTPLASLFKRFPRMVRDIASRLGRQVEFVVEGEDTELDRALIEEVADPIIHLVRNAIGHGIEPPEERLGQGKPAVGRVRLAARHVEDRVVITVEDDGAGIDPDRICETAVSKGILTAEEASSLSEEDAIQLLFRPGFSTMSSADDVSGRGVGLDIVRSNIEKLGGTVRVKTALGKWTAFVMSVPLTLAVFRALLVKAAGQRFAVPLSSVVEVTQVPTATISPVGEGLATVLRGKVLPVFSLRGFALGDTDGVGGGKRETLVVARFEDSKIGIIVDSLLGEQEIVMKSLGKLSRCTTGLLGASILGDGQVALILDIARVFEKTAGRA